MNPTAEKSSAVGNAAAMREAVQSILDLAYEVAAETEEPGCKISNDWLIETCKAALAAPARNCDRFNSGDCNKDVVDASLAWDKFCAEHYPPGTPVVPKTPYTFWSWVFAPATQKGATDGK